MRAAIDSPPEGVTRTEMARMVARMLVSQAAFHDPIIPKLYQNPDMDMTNPAALAKWTSEHLYPTRHIEIKIGGKGELSETLYANGPPAELAAVQAKLAELMPKMHAHQQRLVPNCPGAFYDVVEMGAGTESAGVLSMEEGMRRARQRINGRTG